MLMKYTGTEPRNFTRLGGWEPGEEREVRDEWVEGAKRTGFFKEVKPKPSKPPQAAEG